MMALRVKSISNFWSGCAEHIHQYYMHATTYIVPCILLLAHTAGILCMPLHGTRYTINTIILLAVCKQTENNRNQTLQKRTPKKNTGQQGTRHQEARTYLLVLVYDKSTTTGVGLMLLSSLCVEQKLAVCVLRVTLIPGSTYTLLSLITRIYVICYRAYNVPKTKNSS